ncbi:MAG: ATP-dependent Clp protease adapter ClpS [Thermodesulfovibrio sp.]|nr:ATP-dependent Clp protease adapter ClpS [Thermodesulfovibrio sp.]
MPVPGLKSGAESGVRERRQTRKPPLYRVYLLNDDYTTMEFVVQVLETVFHKNAVEATRIMLFVHKQGRGLAGMYERQIAEAKITEVHEQARVQGFPLRCTMEKE